VASVLIVVKFDIGGWRSVLYLVLMLGNLDFIYTLLCFFYYE